MTRTLKYIVCIVFLASIVLLEAYAVSSNSQKQPVNHGYINNHNYSQQDVLKVKLNLPSFSAVDAKGDFHIIMSNGKNQSVTLSGNPLALSRVSVRVIGKTLVLKTKVSRSESFTYNSRVVVHIVTPRPLTSIALAGKSAFQGAALKTSTLKIYTKDTASVYIRGNNNIQRIENNSMRDIDLGWVNSRNILISGAGSGWVRIAGSADVLTARLRNSACLEAEHFRANKVYVETEDDAIARVQPVSTLYAFAMDTSNIYYFRVPRQLAGYTKGSGNILKLAGSSN